MSGHFQHFDTDIVGTSATVIEGTQYPGFVMTNIGANRVYIGGPDNLNTEGFPLEPSQIFSPSDFTHKQLIGLQSQRMYGRTASGTSEVRVLAMVP